MYRYQRQTRKVRDDKLGTKSINTLLESLDANEVTALAEHTAHGTHNVLEVARGVARIDWSSGSSTYSIASGSSALFSSVTRNGEGDVTITLQPFYVPGAMSVRVTVSQKLFAQVRVLSSTQVRVWIYQLDGTSNVELEDGMFYIAIHADRSAFFAGTPIAPIAQSGPGEAMGHDKWNQIVTKQATQYERLLVEHTATGAHNAVEIAKAQGSFQYDPAGGGSYSSLYDEGLGSTSRLSTGIVAVELSPSLASPQFVFASVDYARLDSGSPSDLLVIDMPDVSGTGVIVRMRKCNLATGEWAVADADFSISVHGS